MKQTRRPEDEEQLNKTPETPAAADAPQEEPAYSLEGDHERVRRLDEA